MNNYNRIKAVLVEKEQANKLLANTLHKEQATILKRCTYSSKTNLKTLFTTTETLVVNQKDLIVII